MVRRSLLLVPAKLCVSLIVIAIITFLATNAIPGDIARSALGREATPGQLAQFRKDQGLDRPLVERFGTWVSRLVQGDWGTSLVSGRPVRSDIEPKMIRTILLALSGFALAIPISLGAGLFSAKRAGRPSDVAISVLTLIAAALPDFVIGLLLLMVFAVGLRWLPVDSAGIVFSTSLGVEVRAYVLPAVALALTIAPYVTRIMRANARDVIREPYVRSAVLRGVHGPALTLRHIFPNAAAPVVNVLALNLAGSIAGVVALEAVFGFPGAGQLLVQAVGAKDIPTVQALALVFGTFFVLLNLAADLVVVVLTPKLRSAA